MPNVKSIISSHNKKVLSTNITEQDQTEKECNCRNKTECPLEGKCLQKNVIYQATVTTNTTEETYVGLATNFKERYRNHKCSLKLPKRRNETELSKYIWNLKEKNKPRWKIIKKCQPYNITKKCNLCLSEKFIIVCKKHLCSLNRRNELASPCQHKNKFTLRNHVT